MNKMMIILAMILSSHSLEGQSTLNPDYGDRLKSLLAFTVDTISVVNVIDKLERFTVLDTRESQEYDVSHIPGALHVGYDDFDIDQLSGLERGNPVLVYCSVGYRSEKIGEKLQKAGFKNVYNLYGSIFEWVNCGLPVEDANGHKTNKVHTYNKKWSRWVDNKEVVTVW